MLSKTEVLEQNRALHLLNASTLDRVLTAMENYSNQPKWISLENPPELLEPVLVQLDNDVVLIGIRYANDWTCLFRDGEKSIGTLKVTGWQPLPEILKTQSVSH